ncbi:hypothetical protein H9P43_008362 [Blastocladiella emersonii ATCC 22665]|nr:hypothetical protein H9P43_008362 [Blastocladiella emersonii ATCC 22665]
MKPLNDATAAGSAGMSPRLRRRSFLLVGLVVGLVFLMHSMSSAPAVDLVTPPASTTDSSKSSSSSDKSPASPPAAADAADPSPPAHPSRLESGGPFEPRWDTLAVAIKSGKAVVDTRFPRQLNTTLRGIRNLVLIGDANATDVAGAGIDMVDVVTGATKAARMRLKAAKKAVPAAKKEGGAEDDWSDTPPALHRRGLGFGYGSRRVLPRADLDHEVMGLSKRAATPARTEDSAGWKADASKFIPAVRALYDAFPKADWYIIGEDDTYIFFENLSRALSAHDPGQRLYFGAGNIFAGCDGVTRFGEGPAFANGGSGIVLSRGAVAAMLPLADDCTVKYDDCWAGDVRLALCLRDAGITITNIGSRGGSTGAGGRFMQESPESAKFAFPDNRCDRPLSVHHVSGDAMDKLYRAERDAGKAAAGMADQWALATPESHAYLFSPGSAKTPAAESPFYAPVTMADVWTEFREAKGPEEKLAMWRPGAHYAEVKVPQVAKCRARCIEDPRCVAWDYSIETASCRLLETAHAPQPKMNMITGVAKGRYMCQVRSI